MIGLSKAFVVAALTAHVAVAGPTLVARQTATDETVDVHLIGRTDDGQIEYGTCTSATPAFVDRVRSDRSVCEYFSRVPSASTALTCELGDSDDEDATNNTDDDKDSNEATSRAIQTFRTACEEKQGFYFDKQLRNNDGNISTTDVFLAPSNRVDQIRHTCNGVRIDRIYTRFTLNTGLCTDVIAGTSGSSVCLAQPEDDSDDDKGDGNDDGNNNNDDHDNDNDSLDGCTVKTFAKTCAAAGGSFADL